MSILKLTDPEIIAKKKITDHFAAREFACNHCGKVMIDLDLVNQLEQFRSLAGNVPIQITSPYRCPEWNKHEGGSSNSLHMQGRAVDFEMYNKFNGVDMFKKAVTVFNRVGFYHSNINPKECYMHVDNAQKGTYWLSFKKVVGKTSTNKPIYKRTYIYFKNLDNMFAFMNKDTEIDWFNLVI